MYRHRAKTAVCKPGRELQPGTELGGTMLLDLLKPTNTEDDDKAASGKLPGDYTNLNFKREISATRLDLELHSQETVAGGSESHYPR